MTGWTQHEADAWIGLLETHKQLTRALDAELEARHGLTLSSLEVLGRLAAGNDLRISWASERRRAAATFARYRVPIDPGAQVSQIGQIRRAMLAIVRAVEEL